MAIFKKKADASKKEEKAEKKPAAKKVTVKKAVAKKDDHDHAGHDHAGHEHAAPAAARSTGDAYRVLVEPLVTEKYSGQPGKNYAFVVTAKANKLSIKKAIQDVYGVSVTGVRVMNVSGKHVRSNRGYGKRADWRKAVVTVKEGQSIDLFASKNA